MSEDFENEDEREFWRRGQLYRIGRDYWARKIEILSWCADCGLPFSYWTNEPQLAAGHLNRRCRKHKKPGVPVGSIRAPRQKRTRPKQSRTTKARVVTVAKQSRSTAWGRDLLAALRQEKRERRAELNRLAAARKAAAVAASVKTCHIPMWLN